MSQTSAAVVAAPTTIERRSGLSYADFVRDHLMARRPVVLPDAVKAWKATTCWTPQWFRARYPGKIVKTDQGEMVMEDFIDGLVAGSAEKPGPFLREQALEHVFPDLMDQVQPVPIYTRPNWMPGTYPLRRVNDPINREAKLEINFAGGGRAFPYLHFDKRHAHAFITQVYGSKDFVVFPPEQEQFLYPVGKERYSHINDVNEPDLERFPLYAKAQPIRITLQPGESVFMACGWWHTTRVTGPSLSTVISFANASNWSDLARDTGEEFSHRPWFGRLYASYLRSLAIPRTLFRR
jgi:histone arginine demethylase JMJD6